MTVHFLSSSFIELKVGTVVVSIIWFLLPKKKKKEMEDLMEKLIHKELGP